MLKKYGEFTNRLNESDDLQEGINEAAYKKMRRAITILKAKYGFFTELFYKLAIKQARPGDGIKTMATDGTCIIYNPDFVLNDLKIDPQNGVNDVLFVICHEIMHCALLHMTRIHDRDHKIWNYAGDYVINLLLQGVGSIPACGGLYDEKYLNMSTEQVYDLLIQNAKQNKSKSGNGDDSDDDSGDDSGDGSGDGGGESKESSGSGGIRKQITIKDMQGDILKPGSLSNKGIDTKITNPSTGGKMDSTALEKMWKETLKSAALRHKGEVGGNMKRFFDTLLKSKINWKVELKRFVANIFNKVKSSIPNRRFVGRGEYIWGEKSKSSDYKNVVVAIDTSGSIDQKTLNEFGAELQGLFKTYGIQELIVIWCDSEIPKDGIQYFDSKNKFVLNKLEPKGGGGTSFKPPFEWINENLINKGKIPAFVIYFTDAYGDAPSRTYVKRYADRVLWVITGDNDGRHLDFGKKIHLSDLPDSF